MGIKDQGRLELQTGGQRQCVNLRQQSRGCPLTWCSWQFVSAIPPANVMSPGVSVMSPDVSARSPWLLLAIPTGAAQPAALGRCRSQCPGSTSHCPGAWGASGESLLAGAYFPPVAINRGRRTGSDQGISKLASEWSQMNPTLHLAVTVPPPIFTWGCTTT